ncbi:hypothetical protein ACFZBU_27785 [Embleya sp. NPDC008237]|uniref:hypothetical protein n=1 Tax=Embleya sp. NPDC008237 TaxID=3363978 RepID=UPI0036E90724
MSTPGRNPGGKSASGEPEETVVAPPSEPATAAFGEPRLPRQEPDRETGPDRRPNRKQEQVAHAVEELTQAELPAEVHQKVGEAAENTGRRVDRAKQSAQRATGRAKETATHRAEQAKEAAMHGAERAKDSTAHKADQAKEAAKHGAERAKEATLHRAEQLKEAASHAGDQVKEAARHKAAQAGHKADRVRETAGDRIVEAKDRTVEVGRTGRDQLFDHTPDPLRHATLTGSAEVRKRPLPAIAAAVATVALLIWAIRRSRR